MEDRGLHLTGENTSTGRQRDRNILHYIFREIGPPVKLFVAACQCKIHWPKLPSNA